VLGHHRHIREITHVGGMNAWEIKKSVNEPESALRGDGRRLRWRIPEREGSVRFGRENLKQRIHRKEAEKGQYSCKQNDVSMTRTHERVYLAKRSEKEDSGGGISMRDQEERGDSSPHESQRGRNSVGASSGLFCQSFHLQPWQERPGGCGPNEMEFTELLISLMKQAEVRGEIAFQTGTAKPWLTRRANRNSIPSAR